MSAEDSDSQAEREKDATEPAGENGKDVGRLCAEDVARGVTAECRAKALVLRALKQHDEDDEDAHNDCENFEQTIDDADPIHKKGADYVRRLCGRQMGIPFIFKRLKPAV